jgi:hypothetical protein
VSDDCNSDQAVRSEFHQAFISKYESRATIRKVRPFRHPVDEDRCISSSTFPIGPTMKARAP